MHFVGYVHCVAVWLTADVQQYRRLAVGSDDRVNRLDARPNGGYVTNMRQVRPPGWS